MFFIGHYELVVNALISFLFGKLAIFGVRCVASMPGVTGAQSKRWFWTARDICSFERGDVS